MSKYNLMDIYEEYQIGSGWTKDFDYDGMLKTGLKTGVDTDIELLKKLVEDFTDVNYHREASHLYNAIEALEEGATKEASMFFGDFHAEIKATMRDQGMDIEPTVGQFMASKMEENTEAVDLAIEASQEKAGIKEDKEMDEIAGYDRKGNKQQDTDGSDATKYKKAAMDVKEVRIEKEVASRIEGLMNIKLKAQFLDVFEDLWLDLIEDEPFYAEDVIAHLSNEMSKQINNRQAQGDRLAGMEEADAVNFNMKADADYDEGLEDIEEALPKFKGVPEKPSIIRALKVDGNGTKMEIDSYMASLKRSGDEFDDVDDYVEDFKNYVADKSLQEHFKRFM